MLNHVLPRHLLLYNRPLTYINIFECDTLVYDYSAIQLEYNVHIQLDLRYGLNFLDHNCCRNIHLWKHTISFHPRTLLIFLIHQNHIHTAWKGFLLCPKPCLKSYGLNARNSTSELIFLMIPTCLCPNVLQPCWMLSFPIL